MQKYDIDHIIPQAKLKDDSFENKVLVEKQLNNAKQDEYPIPSYILSDKGKQWVKKLHEIDSKLMSESKMNKILRPIYKPLTDDELTGFVNRQLTITNQSVKAVCDILKITEKVNNKEPRVVFSKASLVSDFRKTFNIYKCRDLNDYHHAHDAYLNIVVGNTYDKLFTNNFTKELFRERDENNEGFKIDAPHLFSRDLYSKNTRIWHKSGNYDKTNKKWIEDKNDDGTINTVKKYIYNSKPLITNALYTQPGMFGKSHIHSATDGDAILPLKDFEPFNKGNWQTKYGGYNDLTTSYFVLVQSEDKKGKHIYSLEGIPKIIDLKANGDYCSDAIKTYLIDYIKLKNPHIIIKCLIRTIIEFKNPNSYSRVMISGKSKDTILYISYKPLVVVNKYMFICYAISKLFSNIDSQEQFKKYHDNKIIINGKEINELNINEFYEYIWSNILLVKEAYTSIPGIKNFISAFKSKKGEFYSLNLIKKCYCIYQIMQIFACKNRKVNMQILNLPKDAAIVRSTKKLEKGTKIIETSYTGLYETIIFTVPEE